MNNKNEIMPTNEIVGAILQIRANEEDLEKFKSSPSDFLQVTTEIAVVENEFAMVHLCLPYYECIESTGLNAVTDIDLASILGGEIGIVALTGAFAVGAFAIAGIGLGVVANDNANQGKNLDGTFK